MLNLDDEPVGVYLLDVSGHSVQAALKAVAACRSLSNHKDASSVLWDRRDGSSDDRLLSPAAAEQLKARFVAQSLSRAITSPKPSTTMTPWLAIDSQ